MIRYYLTLLSKAFLEKVDTGFLQKNVLKQESRAVKCVNINENRSNVFFKSKGRLILILTLLFVVVNGLRAQEVALEQKQALVQKIDEINQGLEAREISLLVDALPPRFYQKVAEYLQRDVKALRDEFAANLQQQFDNDGMNTYRFDSSAISYHEAKIKGGEVGQVYALVPTRAERQDIIYDFYTLALYDEDWYLIQGGQKAIQNPVFLELYPLMGEITIPPAQNTKKQ